MFCDNYYRFSLLFRYDEIESKMIPFLRMSGYNVKKGRYITMVYFSNSSANKLFIFLFRTDVQFLPISGLLGYNIKTKMDPKACPWWSGSCLFDVLDAVEVPPRDPNGPVRC